MIRSTLLSKKFILLYIFGLLTITLSYFKICEWIKQEHLKQLKNQFSTIQSIWERNSDIHKPIQFSSSAIYPGIDGDLRYQVYSANDKLIYDSAYGNMGDEKSKLPDSIAEQLKSLSEPFHHFLEIQSPAYLQLAGKLNGGQILIMSQSTETIAAATRALLTEITLKSSLIALALLIPAFYFKKRFRAQVQRATNEKVDHDSPMANLWEIWNQLGIGFSEANTSLTVQSSAESKVEDANSHYEFALQWFIKRDLIRAKEILISASRIGFDHFNTWYLLGIIFAREKFYNGASNAFNQASKIDPNHQKCLYRLGLIYGVTGQEDKFSAICVRLEQLSSPLARSLQIRYNQPQRLSSISQSNFLQMRLNQK